ncbi:type IV secretory system conjugative DNA transfer family protein [Prevotella histicola]|uniref:type IV secretory system conjugative DNA transfer family protein n=1 Tax=Prevotella histicola TaxID=470565 RepID=UPI001C5E7587|nr:type IV secretory system conjugative DNA transfer family protein [Prevotella histicola]MBW4876034.1 type IV secretory system conjugative DNA transfer family protein [Prevotella histicola]
MEESKELQSLYRMFRMSVYVSIGVEFFMFALDPVALDYMNGIVSTIHESLSVIPIYDNIYLSKLTTILLLCIASMGTKAKKDLEFNAKKMVTIPLTIGLILTIASVIIFEIGGQTRWYHIKSTVWLYMAPSIYGIMMMNVALDNISKYFKDGLLKDRFNYENESFKQCEEEDRNEYSVNIPMQYYYKRRFRHGFVNIVNPFRGTFVVGPPGSGKTFSIIEPFIRQHSEKGFSMVVYDYKFPTLATKLYYQYRKNQQLNKIPEGCQFNMINFVNVEYSRRINPIQQKYIPNLAAAQETAETLVESLQKGKKDTGGSDQFFQTSATNFLAACIYFFVNYDKKPYDENGKELVAEYIVDKGTGHKRLTGRVFLDDTMKVKVQPAYWLGKYSDMPHVLSFLNHSYEEIFEVLETDPEVYPLLGPFMTAFKNRAMEQLEGMIGTLRVQISRLATRESYWVFSADDFDLKVSDPKHPSYLLIANDPEMESIIGALNAMILNRLVTRVNSGLGKNVPVSIIVDELPTLYFHKIDRLIGTARSNKVAVTLGFQELPQLEADYGKVGMQKIITTISNVIAASARSKETLDWLSNDIFGKVLQMKKGVTIDRDKTSINFNENLDSLVPAAKITEMKTGWICGLTAKDFKAIKTDKNGSINIQESKEFETAKFYCKTNFDMNLIKEEEGDYENYPIPKFYEFESQDAKERVLYANFERINAEVKEMVDHIQKEVVKK